MYLDTDIILALVKKEDWLKRYVDFDSLQPARTSVFTLIEARLVLEREYSRKEALAVLSTVLKKNISLLSLDECILKKSQELLEQYIQLNHFDSIHAAFALVHDETLVSTDHIFKAISGLKIQNPRSSELRS